MSDNDFTAMVCSKILHDLAGPIGAVMNGTELLDEGGSAANKEIIELLKSSSEQLTALLQVFRVAFGALSTGGDEVETMMIKDHLETYTKFKGVPLTWDPETAMIHKDIGKMLVNGVFLFADLARKKGQIQISTSSTEGVETFSIAAFGQGISIPEEFKQILESPNKPGLSTKNIPAFMIAQLAEDRGVSIRLGQTPNGIVLQGQSKK